MATKMIPLATWAAEKYDPPPSQWVLRKWVRQGQIYPSPEKVGHAYYVEATARRQNAALGRPSLVDRIKAAR